MEPIISVNDAQFQQEVMESEMLTVVDFGAEWCGPCKKLEPIIKELAESFRGRVKFVEVDVDKAPETALRYGITSVPQLLFFKEGKVLETIVGLMPRGKLEQRIEQYLK